MTSNGHSAWCFSNSHSDLPTGIYVAPEGLSIQTLNTGT